MIGFNYKKSVQALNFFAIQEGGQVNKMKSLKYIWLSERLHLRKYGRLILNDAYFALKYGPVASNTKDLAEGTSFLSEDESAYRNAHLQTLDDYTYKSVGEFQTDVFSDSDIQVMKVIYQTFSGYSEFQLSDESHKYTEWKKYESYFNSGSSSRFLMEILDFFENSENNHSIFEAETDYLATVKEIYLENQNALSLI